jgi:sec-independent protein translocase protein TatA
MPSIGPMELIIVLVVVLLALGPKRLPDAGRSLGRGMREFKDSMTGRDEQKVELPDGEPRRRATPRPALLEPECHAGSALSATTTACRWSRTSMSCVRG